MKNADESVRDNFFFFKKKFIVLLLLLLTALSNESLLRGNSAQTLRLTDTQAHPSDSILKK